jgi:hypothetical protein
MRHRVRVLKATDAATPEAPKVTKLTDITVEEVSIVDRPATRRKFIMVKRAAGAPEPQPEPSMKISPEQKQLLSKKVDAARQAIEQMTAAINGAEESADAQVPAALTKAMTELGALLAGTPAQAPAATPPAASVTPDTDVNKAGRKISQVNQTKLEAALAALTELFANVAGEPATDAVPDIAATAKSATPPAAAPAAVPSAELAAIEKAISELTATMSSVVKAVKTQRTLLDQVRNVTPESRSVDIDKSADDAPAGDEPEFTWSLDMNRPLGKENVPLEKRF